MNVRTVLLFTVSLTASGLTHAGNAIQLAWQQLLGDHAGLSAESELLNSAKAQVDIAKAKYLPRVDFNAQYNAMNDDIGLWIDTSALIPNGQPVYFPVQEQTFWDSDITVSLPIFTGGRIAAGIEASEADVAMQKAEQYAARNDLFVRFVQRYLSVNLTAKNSEIRRLALENLEQHLQRAIRQHEEGTIAYTDRLQAEVERDKAQREWRNAVAEQVLAERAYRALFQSDVSLPLSDMAFKPMTMLDASALAQRAIQMHPGRQQILAQQDKANAGLRAAKADFLPTVAIFAQAELAKDDLTQLDPQWTAGVTLQWQVFGQGNRFAEIDQYQAMMRAADYKVQQADRDIQVLVVQNLTTLDHARENYRALASSMTLADENLRLRQVAFEQGLATALDEIDAQLLLTGLQLESQKALFDYYVALANLTALTAQQRDFFQLFDNPIAE